MGDEMLNVSWGMENVATPKSTYALWLNYSKSGKTRVFAKNNLCANVIRTHCRHVSVVDIFRKRLGKDAFGEYALPWSESIC